MMNQSPVIGIFCYKRAAKLKTSVEALLKNPECKDLEIFFFCDGYKGEKDKDGVLETRSYIDSLSGFKKIHKHYREKNFSTGPNFHTALTFLSTNYERFIIIEDDVVVSSNYIKYMLDGLEFYKNDKNVFALSGYSFPLQLGNYQYDSIVYKRFMSYGWASWGNRVSPVKWDTASLQNYMSTIPHFKSILNNEGRDLYRMIKKQISGEISTWDIQMQVHVAINKMFVIFPSISKTSNIGFDNESTNTFGVDYLQTNVDDGLKRSFSYCPTNVQIVKLMDQLKKPYGLPALATRKIINTVIKYRNKLTTKA